MYYFTNYAQFFLALWTATPASHTKAGRRFSMVEGVSTGIVKALRAPSAGGGELAQGNLCALCALRDCPCRGEPGCATPASPFTNLESLGAALRGCIGPRVILQNLTKSYEILEHSHTNPSACAVCPTLVSNGFIPCHL